MNTVAADFHRRAHWATGIKVKAQPVTVTLHRATERSAHRQRDRAIERATLDRIDFHHRRIDIQRRTNFTGIQAIIRVERRLDAAQFGIQLRPKEFRTVFGAEAFAVFPHSRPPYLAVSATIWSESCFISISLRVAHIQRRTHVQHAGVHVAEHPVRQIMAVQQRAEFFDIIRQMLWRHAGIFRERNRLRLPFAVAQQPYGFFRMA